MAVWFSSPKKTKGIPPPATDNQSIQDAATETHRPLTMTAVLLLQAALQSVGGGPDAPARLARRRAAAMFVARAREWRRVQLDRANKLGPREYARVCAYLRWHRPNRSTLIESIPPATEREKKKRSTCKYCGELLKIQKRGRQKLYCDDTCRYAAKRKRAQWDADFNQWFTQFNRDRAEKRKAFQHFKAFLAQAQKEKSTGGDVAKFVKLIPGGWATVERWLKTNPESVWRDLRQ